MSAEQIGEFGVARELPVAERSTDEDERRTELVAEGDTPVILASIDYVRPGRDPLIIVADPLLPARLKKMAVAKE